MKSINKILFLAGIVCLLLSSCRKKYEIAESRILTVDNVKRVDDAVLEDSLGHFQFSRLSRPGTFGMMADFELPEKNQDCDGYVIVSGRVRSNYVQSEAFLVVVTHKDQEQLSWQTLPVRLYTTHLNAWCPFKDSIFLPAKMGGKAYNKITVAAQLANSKDEVFDLDTLYISIKQKL